MRSHRVSKHAVRRSPSLHVLLRVPALCPARPLQSLGMPSAALNSEPMGHWCVPHWLLSPAMPWRLVPASSPAFIAGHTPVEIP